MYYLLANRASLDVSTRGMGSREGRSSSEQIWTSDDHQMSVAGEGIDAYVEGEEG